MLVFYKSKAYELVKSVGETTFLKELTSEEIIDVDTKDVEFINPKLIESQEPMKYDDVINTGAYKKESIRLGIQFINTLINNDIAMDELFDDDLNFNIALPDDEGFLNVEIWIDEGE